MRRGASFYSAALAAVAFLGLSDCRTPTSSDSYEPIPELPQPDLERTMEIGFPIDLFVGLNYRKGLGSITLSICVDGEHVDKYRPCEGGRIVKANSPAEDLKTISRAHQLIESELYDNDTEKIGLLGKYEDEGLFRIKGMIVGHQEIMFPSFFEYHPNEIDELLSNEGTRI